MVVPFFKDDEEREVQYKVQDKMQDKMQDIFP